MIIIPWNQSVKNYVDLKEDVGYIRPAYCPNCKHPHLIFWGKRKRYASDEKSSFLLFVRRVKCKGCGKTHTCLPAFLLKNQTYLCEAILRGLILVFIEQKGSRSAVKEFTVPRSTIRRWIGRFKESAKSHYQRLLFLKNNLYPHEPPVLSHGYPQACLSLCFQLFKLGPGDAKKFDRYLSLTTYGSLLFYHQPYMAP